MSKTDPIQYKGFTINYLRGEYRADSYAGPQFSNTNLAKLKKEINQYLKTESKNTSYAEGGEIKRVENDDEHGASAFLMGYEPYFEKDVNIASIDDESKTVKPTHGYYPNHPLSKKAKAWAKKNRYKYVFEQGGSTYAEGGEIEEEKKKLDEAINSFEEKIKSQGIVTDARDEEHLSRLKAHRKALESGSTYADGGEIKSNWFNGELSFLNW
jgi:hypothetical protein